MVPNVNARGTSFKGVTAYLMHDKGNAVSSERVAWSATRNLHTNDIENAAKIMAYTDMNADSLKQSFGGSAAGAKREAGAVHHFSLSESPEHNPTQEQWENYVEQNIKVLGLEEHQYYMVAHNDQEHDHVHVVVNLIHPQNGKINSLHNDYKKMDRLAHEYELENGIVCEERNKKYQAWEQKKQAFTEKERRAEYGEKVTTAFQQSDNAKSFKAALEYEGLTLAQGNRRGFVLVDDRGEIYALNRLITFDGDLQRKEKNAAIKEKLQGIDKAALPMANQLQESRQFIDKEAIEIESQAKLSDAAEITAQEQIKAEAAAHLQAKQQKVAINNLSKKIFKEKSDELKAAAKIERENIKYNQVKEKSQLEQKLRNRDTQKEAQHRKHWQTIIESEKTRKTALEAKYNRSGISGLLIRGIRGKEIKEDISAINKNIENAENRLSEGVGGLTGGDKYQLGQLSKTHYQQRQEINKRLYNDIKQAKNDSQLEAERMLTNEKTPKQETTKDRAAQYIKLAQNPLQDLCGWMDETDRKRGINLLPTGQGNSARNDKTLLPVRAEGAGANEPATERKPQLTNKGLDMASNEYQVKFKLRQKTSMFGSLDYWESVANVDEAEKLAQRSQATGKSVRELMQEDEDSRKALLFKEQEQAPNVKSSLSNEFYKAYEIHQREEEAKIQAILENKNLEIEQERNQPVIEKSDIRDNFLSPEAIREQAKQGEHQTEHDLENLKENLRPEYKENLENYEAEQKTKAAETPDIEQEKQYLTNKPDLE